MRGGDDDAEGGAEGFYLAGDGGGGQHAERDGLESAGGESGGEGAQERFAGGAGVAPDEDAVVTGGCGPPGERPAGGGAAEAGGKVFVDDGAAVGAADAVGAEIVADHGREKAEMLKC